MEIYTIAPEYQRELYVEVRGARYEGYETSVTNMGAAPAIDPFCVSHTKRKRASERTSEGKTETDEETDKVCEQSR